MDVLGVTKIGRGNATYWIEAVAEGGEDYYTKPGERPGEWMGDLAAELGLVGEVDREDYFALLDGKNPKTGEVLVNRQPPRVYTDAEGRTRRKEPILGYDIRFSAPKSVSLLWAVGSPDVQEVIERCLDEANRAGLSYLERHACFVQRGKGGAVIEPGEGFISMGFLHRSSRAGDPSLHTHIVTANITRAASDGKWLSLANPKSQSPLLREGKAAGYVMEAALRASLTRELGLEWGPVVNGIADLTAVPRPTIEHFSRRRAEIQAEMAERGTSSAAAAEVAAYRTRDAKDYEVDADTQRSEWRAQAAEFDLTERSIASIIGRGEPREPKPITDADLDAALGRLEATHSHFDRGDLLCAIADEMREGADPRHLEAALNAVIGSSRLVEVHRGDGPLGTTYYTTPRLWEMEQRVMKAAASDERAGAGVVDDSVLAAVLDRHSYLSAEQVEMVRRLTTGGERIATIAARPGTGKTTALRAAREAWFEADVRGIGVATARSASGELADAGVPSMSITALLIRCEEAAATGASPLPRGTVILVDEASTTSTPQLSALVDLAEACDGKVVTIGDTKQIGAVGPGGLYGRLTTVTDVIELTEIRRQQDPTDRRIVELAHEGRGSDALDLLRANERLVITDTLDQSLDALTLDWHRSFAEGKDAVMIARRIRDVADLNDRAREVLRAEGHLGTETIEVGGRPFAAGDRVITRVNKPRVSNRERWEIVGLDSRERNMRLRRIGGDGREVILGSSYLTRRTDNGDPAIQHAYALTTYATESKTFDTAFALLDAGIASEDFLVAVSRARGETTAYAVAASELLDADLGPATREIEDAVHDIRIGAERVAAEYAASEVADREAMKARPAHELAERREMLRRKAEPAGKRFPADEQLRAVDDRIAEAHERLAAISAERAAIEAGGAGDRHRLSLLQGSEQMTRKQLLRLEADRQPLEAAVEASSVAERSPLSAAERTELALIEDRLLVLRRREVRKERIEPSEMIVEALGPRPNDATRAALWNEGVDLIVGYRQANRIVGHRSPLGPKPREAAQRRARRDAEQRLRRIQQMIARDKARAAERATEISR